MWSYDDAPKTSTVQTPQRLINRSSKSHRALKKKKRQEYSPDISLSALIAEQGERGAAGSSRVVADEFDSDERPRLHLLDLSKLTPWALREAALRFLDRQDGSVEQVRRSLKRRAFRYGNEEIRSEVLLEIEGVLLRLQEMNYLDDERFAVAYCESLRRRGASTQKIKMKMGGRGLCAEHIENALEQFAGDEELTEEASCALYAKKRRLITRYDLNEPKERQKALASLARQGFSFDVAKSVLGI